MKKRLFVIYVFLFIFGLFFLTNCSNNSNTETGNLIDSARTIKVVQLEGSANVRDNKETVACFKGMNLYDGDVVDVLANSTLVVKFDEDKYVYLAENTTINIKSDGKDKFKTNIFVEKGKVLAEIQNKLGEDEEFFLSSNNSVMAVRGTTFGLQVLEKANEFIEIYSVFKGVTELVVFDKLGDNIIKGKLSDISNSKVELSVPKDKVIGKDNFDAAINNWLKDINDKFDNPEDANDKLDEVQIKVDKPSKEDYQEVIDTISDETTVSYSSILYKASGYFGVYDGLAHKINIDVTEPNAKVYYKSENSTEYSENNTFEYITPGSYRVYYKIVCEGFDDKEDFEVIQINPANLTVSYIKDIETPNVLLAGTSLEEALKNVDLFEFIELKGLDADNAELLKSTFKCDGYLLAGTNEYKVDVILPDTLKGIYKDISINIILTAGQLALFDSTAITFSQNGPSLDITEINSFNKYNGVLESELFDNANFVIGNQMVGPNDYKSVTYSYDSLVDGYYELVDGINYVDVTITALDDSVISARVSFNFIDARGNRGINLNPDETTIKTLSDGNYYINTNELLALEGNKFSVPGTFLTNHFGIANFNGYINLPDNVLGNGMLDYATDQNFTLDSDKILELEFVYVQNSSFKTTSKKVNIYLAPNEPAEYPVYTIKDNLKYKVNSVIDFVESTSPVVYSLDGENYNANLTIPEVGTYKVYYKVGNNLVLTGSETVSIENPQITSDYLDQITGIIEITSNDNNNSLEYSYQNSDGFNTIETITSDDGSIISPLNRVYEIYSNTILNGNYYDSVTKEALDVNVTVSEKKANSADFSYEISCDGYDTIYGNVKFNMTEYGYLGGGNGKYSIVELEVTNPNDLEVSKAVVNDIYPTPICFSVDEIATPTVEYSIDNGKTWTTSEPVLTEVGTYRIYVKYHFSAYLISKLIDSNLVAIQNITITE